MPGILELPNELLLEVALDADVTGIQGLSLACRQLRPIGQEALLRTAVVPLANIWKLACTLQERPDLAKSFTHMRLGGCTRATCDKINTAIEKQCLEAALDGAKWNAYCDTLVQSYPAVQGYRLEMEKDPSGISFGVFALIAVLAPSLKALILHRDAVDGVNYMRNLLANNGTDSRVAIPERRQQASSLLKSRLESFEIWGEGQLLSAPHAMSNRNSTLSVLSAQYVSLAGFNQLKRLVVPFNRIVNEPTHPNWGTLTLFPQLSRQDSYPNDV